MFVRIFTYVLFCAVLAIMPLKAMAVPDSLVSLADVEGADMTLYDLYVDSKGKDTDRAMENAELFLLRIDSQAVHPIPAHMGDELADWYENTRFLFSVALRWKKRSLYYYEQMKDVDRLANSEYVLARLYYKKGEYHKALKYVSEAQGRFYELQDSSGIADCSNLLGALYYVCGDYRRADRYFREYAGLARALNDSVKLVYALNNTAVYSNVLQDSARTQNLIMESIGLCRGIGDSVLLGKMYLGISASYINSGRFADAGRYLDLASDLVANFEELGQYWHYRGVLEFCLGEYGKAKLSLEEAIEQYGKGEFGSRRKSCMEMLQEIYAMEGNYKSAYETLHDCYLADRNSSARDVFLELFRSQNEIVLRQEKEKMLKRQNQMTVIIAGTLMVMVIVVLLFVFISRRKSYRIKQREAELAAQKEILEVKKMEQFKTRSMVNEVICSLRDLDGMIKNPVLRSRISSICSNLGNSCNGKEWKEISQYIPEFNGAFMHNLVREHPDLTVNERRLCVLLNMNLTTKEISEITRQSPMAINRARGRLRGKLGITGGNVSIQEFLSRYN